MYTCEKDGINAIDPCLPTGNIISILDQPAKLAAVNEFQPGATYYMIGMYSSHYPSVLPEPVKLQKRSRIVDLQERPGRVELKKGG